MQSIILERLAQRVSLKIDIEESRLASKMRKAVSKIKSHQKGTKRIQESRGGLYSMGARGVYVKDGDLYSRNVIIKARYIKNNGASFKEKIKAHLAYISRDHAGKECQKAELFSDEESKEFLQNTIANFNESPHNFRFIISPEDGDKIDLKYFSKNLLKTIESDLNTKINWVASCHYDTNEPHVHLVIDGRDKSGEKLLMTRDYISRGIRNRASTIINNKLGLKTKEEIIKNLEINVNKNNKNYLDNIIKNNIKNGVINLTKINNEDFKDTSNELLKKRISYLETKELATKSNEYEWTIKENYLQSLRELSRTSSIVERLSHSLLIDKERCELVSPKSLLEDKVHSGQVISRGYVNEIDDQQYLVLKTEQAKYLYIELEKYSEKTPSKIGDWVRITTTKPFDGPKPSDHSIARVAKDNSGIYDAHIHEKESAEQKKLAPGVSAREYVQVHLKRLEILAKLELVTKLSEKKFSIPHNFIEKVNSRSNSNAQTHKPHIKVVQITSPTLGPPSLSRGLKK